MKIMEDKHAILIAGAGKMGTVIASLLATSDRYTVCLADIQTQQAQEHLGHLHSIEIITCDVQDKNSLDNLFQAHHFTAIVSSLPYYCNIRIAKAAKKYGCHYFDLTEDNETAQAIDQLANGSKSAFVPQCGVAPGLINIIAQDMMKAFDSVDTVKLRCGALPEHASNALGYALTWSTDGLINEYANPCRVLEGGHLQEVPALSECEKIQIDGLHYEAFNTSGGVGSLVDTYAETIQTLNYKSIRYPGHCEKMRFLMRDLKLKEDRNTLKKILENALAYTNEDVVILYVSVTGHKEGRLESTAYSKKYYPAKIAEHACSAIQAITACSAAVVIDTVLTQQAHYHGRIKQEEFVLDTLLKNRFASYLNQQEAT